jgi:hypothetical protein
MDWTELNPSELIGAFLGLFFTISIFSYILGDNVLFRLAIHIFIGVTAGFVAIVVFRSVILPQLLLPILSGSQSERLLVFFPLFFSVLLLLKIFKRFSAFGSPIIAFLVGVGAAAAIGGATLGTLFPQISASVNPFSLQTIVQNGQNALVQLLFGGIILFGTITTFAYFQFNLKTQQDRISHGFSLRKGIAWIGQAFIAVTFGVLYAGVLGAALTALIERLGFLWDFLITFIMPTS